MTTPNYLLISLDSLRHDFCSFLNEEEQTMDAIDDLAENSTVFENAISPSVWTLPVHASIFTGLYPSEHKLIGEQRVLGNHPTLGEILSNSGYENKSFGHNKWLQTGDILRGFTHYETPIPGLVKPGIQRVREGLKDRTTRKTLNGVKQIAESAPVKAKKAIFRHQLKGLRTVNNCIQQLNQRSSPFCYFVHLNDIHMVYRPHIRYYREFGNESIWTLHKNILYQEELKSNRDEIYTGDYVLSEEKLEIAKKLYRACILQTDQLVRSLIEALISVGEYDNTVIILFGDHGDLFGEHNLFGHAFSVADELIRVPLLIFDPTGTFPAERRQDVVQLNDIYPTVIEMAGDDPPNSNSVPLQNANRDIALSQYVTNPSKIGKIDNSTKFSRDDYPPHKQYAFWADSNSKVIYYPEQDEYEYTGESDGSLRRKADEFMERLNEITPHERGVVSKEVEENLKRMGYL